MSDTYWHPLLGSVTVERLLPEERAWVLIEATGEAAAVCLDELTMPLEGVA